ncbi:MAG: hypothetical protein HYY84_08200 [Deltaproteobacteria bacterium]|nr:hypothetical protein [Deltaproteobacteria bacterium]
MNSAFLAMRFRALCLCVAVVAFFFSSPFCTPKLIDSTGSTTSGVGASGDRCFTANDCDAGAGCVDGSSLGMTSYCAATCGSDANCPGGMRCQPIAGAPRCLFDQPPPALGEGAVCPYDLGCLSLLCARDLLGAGRTCSRTCVATAECAATQLCGSDGGGPLCVAVGDAGS